MDCKTKIKELRESTGMNRKEFCKYFQIPYRTVTEWELDNRHAPEYVPRLSILFSGLSHCISYHLQSRFVKPFSTLLRFSGSRCGRACGCGSASLSMAPERNSAAFAHAGPISS